MLFFKPIPSIPLKDVAHGALIIDVREPGEYRMKHLPKAINIPLASIAAYQSDQRVYVICQSGMRSKQAVKILRKNGIDAINISGGMNANG